MNTLYDDESGVTASMRPLIQRGLHCLSHGNNLEGISLLMQAHAKLTAEKSQMVSLLETTLDACTRYNQAQEALFNASKNYAKADVERQAQLSILADALATMDGQNMATRLPIVPLHRYLAHQSEGQGNTPSTDSTLPLSSSMATPQSDRLPALSITCFGRFAVRRGEQLLELCRSSNGRAILRYLVAQPGYRATTEVLMDVLWPNEEPDVARRRLQIAISSLRCSLNEGYDCDPGGGYILCKNQLYQINPSVTLQTDVGEFFTLYQTGQHADQQEMISRYEQACHLYQGPFLAEDMYADWSMRRREQLSQIYLTMCGGLSKYFLEVGQYEDAMNWASAMLDGNRCDEDAHRYLMRAYTALGRRSDALRQYHSCEQVLMEELSVIPMLETVQVYQAILLGQ